MCADFVVGETADGVLSQVLVLRRSVDDERASTVFRSQLLAMRSSPDHPSAEPQASIGRKMIV